MADKGEQEAPLPREFPGRPPETADTTPPAEPAPAASAAQLRSAHRPRRRREAPPAPPGDFSLPGMPETVSLVPDSVITRPLAQRMAQSPAGRRIGVLIEVRAELATSTDDIMDFVLAMIAKVANDAPRRRTRSYVFAALTADEIRALVELDGGEERSRRSPQGQMTKSAPRRYVHRIWPNFEVQATIHRSSLTTKADAAVRSFEATGEGIVWAVLDSGVDAGHEHFQSTTTSGCPRPGTATSCRAASTRTPSRTRTGTAPTSPASSRAAASRHPAKPIVAATWYRTEDGKTGVSDVRLERIQGMAPKTQDRLVQGAR